MPKGDENKKTLKRGLQQKIFWLCILLVVSASVGFTILSTYRLRKFRELAEESGKQQASIIAEKSENYIEDIADDSLVELNQRTAISTGWDIWIMNHDTVTLAMQVQDVIEHPEIYEEREVLPPSKENAGKLTLQLLMAENANPTEEDMVLIRKLASLEPTMREMIAGNGYYTQDLIIALPSGLSITMDMLSDVKIDENGKPKPFDPTKRPWWQGVEEYKGLFQSLPAYSELLDVREIEFGVPIYIKDELAAVVEGSISMEAVMDDVNRAQYGQTGFFVIISDDGDIVYSPRESGELMESEDDRLNIREGDNQKLIELLDKTFRYESGLETIQLDGEDYYVAYGGTITVDWALFMFVSKEETERAVTDLVEVTNRITEETIYKFKKNFLTSFWVILIVVGILVIIAITAAHIFSGRITGPINHMTKQVGQITGDSFNFEMAGIYRTGDEIEALAETFEELSVRTNKYIDEITEITAEREREKAELSVASRIQADMLPKHFPLYPDRKEFDLYATMTPAKEVGGDFFDAFLIDDDHLCFDMGDVSGKGVPAALFMAISKAMLKNRAKTGGTPAEILRDVNVSLVEGNDSVMFVTVWLGILTLSTGELVQASAGHEYPVIKRKGGDYELIETENGLVLGYMKKVNYQDIVFNLGSGDELFMYTDGLPEATNAEGKRLELEGMMDALNRHKEDGPETLLPNVRKEVDAFVKDAPQFDDLTMLIVRYNGMKG